MRLFIPVCLIALSLTANAQENFFSPASGPAESSDEPIDGAQRAENVYVTHINKVDIPATAEGVLNELKFEEGDTVNIEDVLAVIESKVVTLNQDLKEAEELEARVKATDDVNLRDAINNEKLAIAEARSFEELAEKGAVGKYDMLRKQLEAEKQKLRIELAQLEEKTKKIEVVKKQIELKVAKAELEKRSVKAPATGFIEKRLANLGQWLQPGTPIATLIQMDRLRVQGDLSGIAYAGRVVKGAPVRVKIFATNADPIEIQGKLGFVSMELNSLGDHRVWVEIENRLEGDEWLVKPGMKAEIELQ